MSEHDIKENQKVIGWDYEIDIMVIELHVHGL